MPLNFSDSVLDGDQGSSPFEGGSMYLRDPYLGPAILKNVEIVQRWDDSPKTLCFTYELTGPGYEGQVFNHYLTTPNPEADWWQENPQEAEAKFVKNTIKTIVHVLYRFCQIEDQEERELWAREQVQVSGWENLLQSVLEAMEETRYLEKTDLMIKIPGTTYGTGKPRLRIPPWPFTADSTSSAQLSWSRNERDENAKYMAKRDEEPTSIDSATSADADTNQTELERLESMGSM